MDHRSSVMDQTLLYHSDPPRNSDISTESKPTKHKMKSIKLLALALSFCALAGAALHGQTVEIDPTDPLTDIISLASWNTDGEQEGWTANHLTPVVSGGLLATTVEAGDPQIILNPINPAIPTGKPSLVVVEFQLQRSATDTSSIQVFWDDSVTGGFAGARSLTLPGVDVPTDGLPHVYRFNLDNVDTNLLGLRIDPSTVVGSELEFDYVNIQVTSGSPVIDPVDLINKFTSLGEWNTPGDFENWTTNAAVSSLSIGSGLLSGTSTGNDPQALLAGINLDTDNGENQIIEMRLRRQANDTDRMDIFWSDAAGGYGGPRRAILPDNTWPTDGDFHIVQFPLGQFITGDLINLRFDPVSNNPSSVTFDIDYVRIGIIDADDDMDGLANSVETNTGIFNGPDDTGTDPNNNDTDGDNFLDGTEVAFGTNPNDINDFPTPILVTYSGAPASYIVDVAITNNIPSVANGTPTGFTIAPALPAGLSIDSSTGVISGTSAAAADSAVYTITATFAGDVTSTYDLTLEVINPGITNYPVDNAGYVVGDAIAPNAPTTFGATPTSYSIAPPLPEGLLFDVNSGEITGTPTTVTPQTEYTVTASYGAAYPDATYPLNIQIKAIPVFIGSDSESLGTFSSLGEWNTDDDLDGWALVRANGTVAGGILNYITTGGDPQIVKGIGVIDTSLGEVLEVRSRQTTTDAIQFFWQDGSGGFGGERAFAIASENIIPDGEYHTYQVDMTGVFVGDLVNFRFDPGTVGGHTVDIDYIRIGTPEPPAKPVVTAFSYDFTFGEIDITWTSTQGTTYRIEASADLNTWTEVSDGLTGNDVSTSAIEVAPEGANFFRVVREN